MTSLQCFQSQRNCSLCRGRWKAARQTQAPASDKCLDSTSQFTKKLHKTWCFKDLSGSSSCVITSWKRREQMAFKSISSKPSELTCIAIYLPAVKNTKFNLNCNSITVHDTLNRDCRFWRKLFHLLHVSVPLNKAFLTSHGRFERKLTWARGMTCSFTMSLANQFHYIDNVRPTVNQRLRTSVFVPVSVEVATEPI